MDYTNVNHGVLPNIRDILFFLAYIHAAISLSSDLDTTTMVATVASPLGHSLH